ncbi:MAG: hypothetical protein ACLUR5_06250 [Eubacterium ventriosum]
MKNQIAISYDIEDVVKHEKVLKLLLQPLVENAVHHGLNAEVILKLRYLSRKMK